MDYRYSSHTVYQLKYHFVWVTKYRHKVLTGEVASRVRELVSWPTARLMLKKLDQVVNGKRPKDPNDLIEMEVEAKNSGLDVYEEMKRPDLPYNYKSEADFRKASPEGYNNAVRDTYRKLYGVK